VVALEVEAGAEGAADAGEQDRAAIRVAVELAPDAADLGVAFRVAFMRSGRLMETTNTSPSGPACSTSRALNSE